MEFFRSWERDFFYTFLNRLLYHNANSSMDATCEQFFIGENSNKGRKDDVLAKGMNIPEIDFNPLLDSLLAEVL